MCNVSRNVLLPYFSLIFTLFVLWLPQKEVTIYAGYTDRRPPAAAELESGRIGRDAEHQPQQVTHPVKQENAPLPQIKPQGISLNGILAAVCAVSILSIGWLWITRKKK